MQHWCHLHLDIRPKATELGQFLKALLATTALNEQSLVSQPFGVGLPMCPEGVGWNYPGSFVSDGSVHPLTKPRELAKVESLLNSCLSEFKMLVLNDQAGFVFALIICMPCNRLP